MFAAGYETEMLREYGGRFTSAWKIVDLMIFSGLFAGLLLHPFFRQGVAVLDDEAMLDIAILGLVGLVIGWLTCPTPNYGREITEENIRRLTQILIDLDSLETVPD